MCRKYFAGITAIEDVDNGIKEGAIKTGVIGKIEELQEGDMVWNSALRLLYYIERLSSVSADVYVFKPKQPGESVFYSKKFGMDIIR